MRPEYLKDKLQYAGLFCIAAFDGFGTGQFGALGFHENQWLLFLLVYVRAAHWLEVCFGNLTVLFPSCRNSMR